ncbi:hypothetical protein R6Q57_002313 [Mikania cordata]
MEWLQSLFSPLKKLWVKLHSAHHKSTFDLITQRSFMLTNHAGRGIYILYEDVKSCPYEDVQVLWSILVKSTPHPLALPPLN